MAMRGQRFVLDPDADDFTFNLGDDVSTGAVEDGTSFVKEIKERDPSGVPPPPNQKQTKTGFPQPRQRSNFSTFRQQHQRDEGIPAVRGPSDQAIISQISRKFGITEDQKEKQKISEENKRRIAQMSTDDIEEARAELLANMNPALIEKLLKRANIEEGQHDQNWESGEAGSTESATTATEQSGVSELVSSEVERAAQSHPRGAAVESIEPQFEEVATSIHFPKPFRNPDEYVALDPDAPSFLTDLKTHYFPDLPNDPSSLAWLQDPTEEESKTSPYAPTQSRYAPSDIRFDFHGRLLAPNMSRDIPVSKGLHHHGQAPESAGYTIPELSILARSTLPNQRCVAYQVLGRVLYRLGRGDFGQRGTELQEGLWACFEKERPIEVMMSEANRSGGHMSAKSYATEALWLWRKGGGGERGILKPGEKLAK